MSWPRNGSAKTDQKFDDMSLVFFSSLLVFKAFNQSFSKPWHVIQDFIYLNMFMCVRFMSQHMWVFPNRRPTQDYKRKAIIEIKPKGKG